MNPAGVLNVALDHDNTVVEPYGPVLKRLNARLGLDMKYEDIKTQTFFTDLGIKKEFFKELLAARVDPLEMPPMDDFTVPVIRNLLTVPCIREVIILTRNSKNHIPHVENWYAVRGLDVKVVSSWSKHKFDFDWKILVDDHPDHHVNVPAGRAVIPFGRPWNDSPVKTWDQVEIAILDALAVMV